MRSEEYKTEVRPYGLLTRSSDKLGQTKKTNNAEIKVSDIT